MSDKISGKIHPIPSTIANQRWISIRNIIIYLETKFRPYRRIFVFGGHFVPWLPWQRPQFWIFSTPQKLPHVVYSYKVDHNMAPKPWISIPNIKIYLETKFRSNRRIFVFWRPPFWIFSTPKSCHTLRWIFLQSFMKFDERNPNLFLIPPFLFPWQLRQSLSNRFRFFWFISFH